MSRIKLDYDCLSETHCMTPTQSPAGTQLNEILADQKSRGSTVLNVAGQQVAQPDEFMNILNKANQLNGIGMPILPKLVKGLSNTSFSAPKPKPPKEFP